MIHVLRTRTLLKYFAEMPFYAVRIGRKPGIYESWLECENQVKGYPKARYKKFNTSSEAIQFINEAGGVPKLQNEFSVKKTTNFKSKQSSSTNNVKSEAIEQRKTILLSAEQSAEESSFRHEFIRRENLPTSPVVYTDGCCFSNGKVGAVGGVGVYWAPCHPRNVSEYLDVAKPTNQIAELRAASRALECAIGMNLKSVELRTDSKYTIKSMTEWIENWRANGWKTSNNKDVSNKEEMIRLSELCKKINVLWVHVPGHEGIYGNEEADRLARQGAIIGRGY